MSPIYEFECDDCGTKKEKFFWSTEKKEAECSDCNKKMRRVFSLTAKELDWCYGRHIENCDDKTFYSKSEYKKYCKANDISPCGGRWV